MCCYDVCSVSLRAGLTPPHIQSRAETDEVKIMLTVTLKKKARKKKKGNQFAIKYTCSHFILFAGIDDCPGPFDQTAYRTARTTITCDYPRNQRTSRKFFCKEKDSTCEDILSANASPNTNGTFTLTETVRGFNVSISNVSQHDKGVYWCAVSKRHYRAGIKKIQLQVEGE